MDNTNKGAGVFHKSSRSLIFFSSLSLILPLFLVPFLSVSAETPNSVPAKNQLLTTYGKLPLSFEANQGQTDEQVKFLSRGRGYSLFLTPSDVVLVLRKADGKGQQAVEKSDSALNPQHSELPSVVRMKLTGANPRPQVTSLSELPGKINYFIGNDPAKWRTNVPTYAKVKYAGVYPGVDAVYYGNQGQLEYDLIVAPGADPKSIALTFEGAEKLELDEKGDLVLQIAGGELRLRKPLVYQEIGGVREEINAGYLLKPGAEAVNLNSTSGPADQNPQSKMVGFQVASYDASKPLIIDPVLVYSTYLGGSGADSGNSIAVDGSGNAYVTGSTASTLFPTTASVYDSVFNGVADVFVTKLNAAGSALLYSTYLGGSGDDSGNGITVDGSGNAYVTGKTNSSNFPVLNAVQAKKSGSVSAFDAFVTKLNAAGSGLVYSTYLGGSSDDAGNGIALESSSTGCTLGCVYVVGFTKSTNFPIKNALRGKNGGVTDVFVAKLSFNPSPKPLLDLVYATYLGGSGDDTGNAIDVDDSGNAYITGETVSSNFPTTVGAFDTTFNGVMDAFVAKLNSTGSTLLYSTYLGGSGTDRGRGVAIDGSGNAYVTGVTDSSAFPTVNALQPSKGGGTDAFVAKVNANGSALIYSTYLGGSSTTPAGGSADDSGNGIAVDTSSPGCAGGCAYLTGRTSSNNFPVEAPVDPFYNGLTDAFVTKLSTAGSALIYSTYLGGSGDDSGNGIAIDAAGNAYVTGSTSSTNFPSTAGPLGSGGGLDAFVAKLATDTPPVIDLNGGAAGTGYTASFTEDGGAVAIVDSGNLTVTDVDNANLASATVTITNRLDGPAESLAATTTGTSIAANYSTGVLSLTGSDTVAHYQQVLRTVKYNNTSQNPNTTDRSVTFKVNDGSVDSNTATSTVHVVPVNDAPVLTNVEGTAVSYTENGAATALTSTLTVNDVDSINLASATAQITTGCTSGDVLSFTDQNGINGVYTPATCTMALTGSSSVANYQTALRAVNYSNGSDNPSTATRTVTFQVNDGVANSNTATRSITITAINDAPVLTNVEGTAVSYTENGAATALTSTLTVSDVDSINLASATAQITTGCTSGDVLSFTDQNGINGVYTPATCTMALTGSSLVANYQTALRAVNYRNSSDNPSTATRTVTFQVNDGAANSNTATRSITVIAVNDKPVASANPPSLNINEDAAPSTVTLSASDAETAAASLIFTITQAPANGVLKLGATTLLFGSTFTGSPTNVTYQPNANFNGADSFKFKITDTGDGSSPALDSDEVTVSITVNAVNDPPFFDSILDQVPITDAFVSQTLDVDITGVSPGTPDELGQTVTVTANVISPSPPDLITSVNVTDPLPGNGPTRILSYQIPANKTGTATIRVTANDGQSANNTFSRDISVTVAADPVAAAAITGLKLGSAFVNYRVTFNPVDRNGDGTINLLDCYSVFPPQPQDNPFNLFPSNALVTPEAPPAVVADTFDTTGFGTTQICTTPKIFEGVIDLSVWGITELGGLTIDFTYVNAVRDPELTAVIGGTAVCNDNPTTCQNILVGSFPAGSIAFTFGGTVSEINTVLLHSVELHSGNSSKKPLANVEARVFNRDDNKFQNQVFVINGKKVKVGSNPSGSLYGAIFESGIGEIAHCHTPGSGICLTTETQVGNYLVIIKFVDSDVTHDGGKIVYEGETLSATSFVDTSVPLDGIGDTAQVGFEIIRKNNDGVFQEYQGGSKTVVCNLSSPGCVP